jgi:hypothetical protein
MLALTALNKEEKNFFFPYLLPRLPHDPDRWYTSQKRAPHCEAVSTRILARQSHEHDLDTLNK